MEQRRQPGEVIRERLRERRWTQADLARVIGRTVAAVNEVIMGKRAITPEMAALLGAAFGDGPEYWLSLDARYRACLDATKVELVQRRVRLYETAPIREMERRGWIRPTRDADSLENALCRFFSIRTIDEQPSLGIAPRKSQTEQPITAAQRAWCFRAFNLARSLHVKRFAHARLDRCAARMRGLAAFPEEARHLPAVLAEFGIRFLIVEPLPGSRIDGATMWIDDQSPVIAVSARYDRVDAFWHTVAHEFFHVWRGDALSIDADLAGANQGPAAVRLDAERIANESAADLLIPRDKLNSFVIRVGPLYSRSRIIQFANRMRIHPGIVVGQLQYRGEIGYSANRELLVKVRDIVTSAALTDGWGHIAPMEI